jgi:lipopolysaccharide transport system permease protein
VVSFFKLIMATRDDFIDGARAWRLWSKFAWHDMLARYRRSWVGPLWLAVSATVFIAALSIVYSTLFQQPIADYVPFIAVGLSCWSFVSSVATEGVMTFVEAETYVRQVHRSPFIYVFRVLWRNVLVFLHQFAVAVVVIVMFGKLSLTLLPVVALGLALMIGQGLWMIPLLGLIGTRFRDLQPIIVSVLQVLFFISPVIWLPSSLGERRWIADINPLTSLIEVVRDPMLGAMPSLSAYAYLVAMTIVGVILSAVCYGRLSARIVYWL